MEGSIAFRRHFFAQVAPDKSDDLARRSWTIGVEADNIDIHLEAEGIGVIIENKLGSGAKQAGQLLKYYAHQRRVRDSTIIAVFLAPGQIGHNEVEQVEKSEEFQAHPDDRVAHLSWDDLLVLPADFDDPHKEWVLSVLDFIRRAIENAYSTKYPRVGERKIVRDMADAARDRLKPIAKMPFRRWSSCNAEEFYTIGSSVYLYLSFLFESDKKSPFDVHGLVCEKGVNVSLKAWVKKAGKVKSASPVAKWWSTLIANERLEIPGTGMELHRREDRFVLIRPIQATSDEARDLLVNAWVTLEQYILGSLQDAGISDNILP